MQVELDRRQLSKANWISIGLRLKLLEHSFDREISGRAAEKRHEGDELMETRHCLREKLAISKEVVC